ncbi:MAG: hypothetical protein U9N63_01700 [Pseudomonadota bacterium]|nr:hypothetical protein [Pseudomonadota bacterium]
MAAEVDPDAEDKAEEINQLLHCHDNAYQELGARLAEQTADLDFEEALKTLAKLREVLDKTDP